VVVDRENTSGFGENSMIAVYKSISLETSLPETQALSISTDGGIEFYYYEGNPVQGGSQYAAQTFNNLPNERRIQRKSVHSKG
jgi:sucrose-6-phosphate hydrolase SacC (GH32 family)